MGKIKLQHHVAKNNVASTNAMKTYGVAQLHFQTLTISALDEGEWSTYVPANLKWVKCSPIFIE